MRALSLLIPLTGCQLVYPLEQDPDTRAASCRHQGLQLCLAFDDAAMLGTDDSPRGLHATVAGVTGIDRLTPLAETEQALDLGSESSVELRYNNAFDYPGPMSIDLWFQYSGHSPGAVMFLLDNSNQYSVLIRDTVDFIDCAVHLVGPSASRFQASFIEAMPNRWHHLACVMTETKWQAYLNGSVVIQTIGLAEGDQIFTGGTEFLELGSPAMPPNNPPPATPFIGQLDNVRIWDRTLTDDEVARFAMGDESTP